MKRVVITCLLAFFVGAVGGSAVAYATNQNGAGSGIGQWYNNWKIARFIDKQEEERPDGLVESKIETGSKYTGITYNAPEKKDTGKNIEEPVANETTTKKDSGKESGGLLAGLTNHFAQKEEPTVTTDNPENQEVAETQKKGRIAIKNGSLNIREQANSEGRIIGQAYKDDTVIIHGREGAWYYIETGSGLKGYVSATYLEEIE